MQPGTAIIYRIGNKGEQQGGAVKDTILEMGSTAYLVATIRGGEYTLEIVRPREIDIIEEPHEKP